MGKPLRAADPQRDGRQLHRYRGRIAALKEALQRLFACIDTCDGHGTPRIKDRAECYVALDEASRALKDAQLAEWTSVDSLPDDDITVMVACKDTDEPVWLGYHDENGWFSATDGVELTKLVTHWKPIPDAPRAD